MSRWRKIFLFLTPSWQSFIVGVVVAASFVAVASFAFAEHSGRLGGFKLADYINSTSFPDLLTTFKGFLNGIKFTSIFFIIFWVIIRIIVYTIVFAFKDSVDESVGFLHKLKYVNAKPKFMSGQVLIRSIILLITLALWVLFALLFSWIILPKAINDINQSIITGRNPAYVIAGFLFILIASHIAVILLRLTFLRVRVTSAVA